MSAARLTDELIEQICTYMGAGAGYERAARMCGIPKRTAYTWRAKGERDQLHLRSTQYAKLWQRTTMKRDGLVTKAEHISNRVIDGALKCTDCGGPIHMEMRDVMQHVRWYLSKLERGDYGDDRRHELQRAIEEFVLTLQPLMPRDHFRSMLRAIQQVHHDADTLALPSPDELEDDAG